MIESKQLLMKPLSQHWPSSEEMETPRRREKYFMNMELELPIAGRRNNVRLHIINLMNRRLTINNLCTLSASMPKLQRRLTGEPEPLTSLANVRAFCLRSPFNYKSEDLENATCCHFLTKPAQVMMTPAGFRPPAGRLLFPVHPNKIHISLLKADRRNDVFPVECEGQWYNRVVSKVYISVEEEVKGWFRVSDYTYDGHMTLSVLCYFPIVEEQSVEQEEPRKKRKREETSTDESSSNLSKRRCLRL